MTRSLLVYGTLAHTVGGELQILEDTYIAVVDGKIASIGKEKPEGDFELVELTPTQLLIPGLIDAHIHAPQYAFAGCGLDLPLLEWLNKYTFPAESKFKDVEHARRVYSSVVENTLITGTTTASYFATIHPEASHLLADICKKAGQRAFIGKVSMDRNSPPNYIEETAQAATSAREFVESFEDGIVQPIVTPRFVPSCTGELMTELGKLASEKHLPIQSHVSENTGEVAWVKELHPELSSYSGVYDHFGLLNEKTILAHGIHLTDEEIELLAAKKSAVIHCPSSNFQLFSGTCDVRKLQARGVKVGLGTDLAGGPSHSMIDAMRNALLCSRSILFQKRSAGEEYKPLTVPEVLALATEGGAQALCIDDKVGNFVVGKEFDAIIFDAAAGTGDCFGEESKTDLLEKFVYLADDRNILEVFVQGRKVKSTLAL